MLGYSKFPKINHAQKSTVYIIELHCSVTFTVHQLHFPTAYIVNVLYSSYQQFTANLNAIEWSKM
jgi:hypothetical protein